MPLLFESGGYESLADGFEHDLLSLMEAGRVPEMELSVTFVDDEEMIRLNSEWRGKSYTTDVLSFPQDDDYLLGDLVICVEQAERQAVARGVKLLDELRVLAVHGLLHLFGYDHEAGREEHNEMAAAEEKLLGRLGWKGEGLIAISEG